MHSGTAGPSEAHRRLGQEQQLESPQGALGASLWNIPSYLAVQSSDEDPSEGDYRSKESVEAIGNLSIDETNEARYRPHCTEYGLLREKSQVRFHDETSGMPLLERVSERSDWRNWGGIWFALSLLNPSSTSLTMTT